MENPYIFSGLCTTCGNSLKITVNERHTTTKGLRFYWFGWNVCLNWYEHEQPVNGIVGVNKCR